MAKARANRKKRPSHVNYTATKRWKANKVKRIARHVKANPLCVASKNALQSAESKL